MTDLRAVALALPEAEEKPHHGFPSFRVRGKIFATWPEPGFAHLMLDEDDIRAAALADPDACAERYWGEKLAALRVDLARIPPDALAMLVGQAWRRRAPAALRGP